MTGFSRGDCELLTEEANSGVYVNGTVDVINENSQDEVTGYGATGMLEQLVVGAITPPGARPGAAGSGFVAELQNLTGN